MNRHVPFLLTLLIACGGVDPLNDQDVAVRVPPSDSGINEEDSGVVVPSADGGPTFTQYAALLTILAFDPAPDLVGQQMTVTDAADVELRLISNNMRSLDVFEHEAGRQWQIVQVGAEWGSTTRVRDQIGSWVGVELNGVWYATGAALSQQQVSMRFFDDEDSDFAQVSVSGQVFTERTGSRAHNLNVLFRIRR